MTDIGNTMQGTRRDAGELHAQAPGEYAVISAELQPEFADCAGEVWFVTPNGHHGRVTPKIWSITVHEDGTVTVSPSIRVSGGRDGGELWHGYLERGVWRTL